MWAILAVVAWLVIGGSGAFWLFVKNADVIVVADIAIVLLFSLVGPVMWVYVLIDEGIPIKVCDWMNRTVVYRRN